MHRFRSAFLLPAVLTTLGASAMGAKAQSVGWVALLPHVGAGSTPVDIAVAHTYVQGASGLVEYNSEEFSPGTHTFARVEGEYQNCTATAENVTFTITAGKWTYVKFPMAFTSCQYSIAAGSTGLPDADGYGTVVLAPLVSSGPSIAVATCSLFPGTPSYYVTSDFHACTGQAAYGAVVGVTETPFTGSTKTFTDSLSFVSDTSNQAENNYGFGFSLGLPHPHPDGLSMTTDVGITLVSGTYGGFVSTSVFRVVNHGSNFAFDLIVPRTSPLNPDDRDADAGIEVMTISDGYCDSERGCMLTFLPPGDSTTVTVRAYAIPLDSSSTAADNFPHSTPTCSYVNVSHIQLPYLPGIADPNSSNDNANCIRGGAVPVTVALGGSPPSNQTVRSGTTNVPMLQFLLTPASPQTITGVTVAASGTGNEQVDVSAVNLYLDKNGNGEVDAGDSVIATGTFATNDGIVSLAVNPGLSITAPTSLLVTYSFTVTIAERIGAGIVLAMFPLLILPSFRRRKTLLAMLIVMLTTVAITACGGDSSTGPKPGNGSVTFKSTLTGITTSTGILSSLAVSGATITVNK